MAQNPYQMDPFLAQGFSNLTRALVGDPETDYQVARTNRVNTLLPFEQAQMEASAARDNSQAGLFDQETADLLAMSEALNLLASDSTIAQAFIDPLGLPKTTPYGQPINIDPEVSGAMVRAILQGGNPDQRASALDTVGGGRARRFAEKQILTGNADEIFRGSRLLSPAGTSKYQDPSFAATELDNLYDIANLESKDDLAADKNEDKLRFDEGGQGDRDTKAKIAGERDVAEIKADAEKEWQEAVQDLKNRSEKELAEIKDATARYDIDQTNKRLKDENVFKQYITVNGEMIVSPELAKELNIEVDPTTNKYTMSFGATESMIDVEIENPGGTNTIVKIAPQNIDKINPVLKNGKLVIPENHNFNAATPEKNRENLNKFNSAFEKDAKNYSALGELPGSAIAKIRDIAFQNLEADMADGKTYDEAYRESVLPILQSPNIKVGAGFFGGGGFSFPEYFYNATRNNSVALKSVATSMGYTNDQVEALVNFNN